MVIIFLALFDYYCLISIPFSSSSFFGHRMIAFSSSFSSFFTYCPLTDFPSFLFFFQFFRASLFISCQPFIPWPISSQICFLYLPRNLAKMKVLSLLIVCVTIMYIPQEMGGKTGRVVQSSIRHKFK